MGSLLDRWRSDSGIAQAAQVGAAVIVSLALTVGLTTEAPRVGAGIARMWICHLSGSVCGDAGGTAGQGAASGSPDEAPDPAASVSTCPPVEQTDTLPEGRTPEETAAIRGNATAAVQQTGGTIPGLVAAARAAGSSIGQPGLAQPDLSAFDGLDGTITVGSDGRVTTSVTSAAGIAGCGGSPGQLALPAWIARGLAGAAGVAAWLSISGGLTWALTPTIGPEEAAIWGNRIGLFFLGFLPPILTPVFEGHRPGWVDAVYGVVGGIIASLSTYWPAALPKVVDGFTWIFQRLITAGGRLGAGLRAIGDFAGDVAAQLRAQIANLPCCAGNPATS